MAFVGRRGALAVMVTVAVALGAAGCAGSGYSYHANRSEKVFFKLPDDWTVFDTTDFLDAGEAADGMWVRGFAAGDRASVDSVFAITSEQPRGYVEVVALEGNERDGLSLATLRGTNFGTDEAGNPIDPIAFARDNPGGPLQILGYDDEVVLDHGPHGVHIRVAVTPGGSDVTAIIDQTVLVDKATTKRYVLNIGCSAACFEAHEKEILEVIESWTLEAT